jgi:dTDP-glucose 4,6-dehydratase
MDMKVLVYGSKGWIGQQFIDIMNIFNVKHVPGQARVDNDFELVQEVEKEQPTHIISLIGRTHGKIGEKEYTTIDYLEEDGKLLENVRDNLYSPLLLAELCRRKQIHFTYLGTGCIFKFDENHPFGMEFNGFHENSVPNFFGSSYSVVKGFTDRLIHNYEDCTLNLRIRMPINGKNNKRNFITKITNYEKICSVPNSMSVLPELLAYALDMMRKFTVGTVNLTNPGLISHNEILEMYRDIVDPTFTWKNFSQDEQRKILAADRSNNFLDTTRLEKLYPQVTHIRHAVRSCLTGYKDDVDSKNKNPSPYTYPDLSKDNNKTGKVLLVTGGCGFIGSNFINYYFGRSATFDTIVNIDAMYYCANENNVDENVRKDSKYVFVSGNLCNSKFVKKVLDTHKITHVIHFAAQSHVQNSFEDSLQFTYDNILGTHTLLECCRKYGKLEKFIHVSTDEVYGESMNIIEEQKKTEHSILCPTNPYAATKAGAELIAQSYNHSYKMPIIITRGNNVYGKNQYPEKVIPRFIQLLKENKKLTIQGDGSAVRSFLHAEDTARAFEIILEHGEIGEIYNIGCDEGMEYSVLDIAKILIRMMKPADDYSDWIEHIEDRPFNDQRYYISNEKLKNLGWNIQRNLLDGLSELIEPNQRKREDSIDVNL